jgi:hypothetical protein
MPANVKVAIIDAGRIYRGKAAVKIAQRRVEAAARDLRERGYSEEQIARIAADGREEGRRRAKELADACGFVLDPRDEIGRQ